VPLIVGVALLVLPGPGLLLVLAGLLVLANAFPAAQRFVRPVRERARKAAEQSVSTRLRLAFSVLTGVALIAAGVVWWLVPTLPLGGWPSGSSLILSGIILLALLVVSYRRVKGRHASSVSKTRSVCAGRIPERCIEPSTRPPPLP
jgi:Putative transmembrane protein (PGPGW)